MAVATPGSEDLRETRAKRALWLAAGAWLACGVAWLAFAAMNGQFASSVRVRELGGLFVLVNGPPVIALVSPGKWSSLFLLVVAAALCALGLVLATVSRRAGLPAGPGGFISAGAFLVLAILAFRAWRGYAAAPGR